MTQNDPLSRRFEDYFKDITPKQNPQGLFEPIRYLLGLGAKRLRPRLCLMGGQLFGNQYENLLPAAAAVELFHNFTLMHDDIMDRAPLRRGAKTVHEKWNEPQAILSGDALLIMAYQQLELLSEASRPPIFKLFNQTALEVCEGQQLDLDFETRDDVSVDEYLEMIRLKTSVLLAASLKMGAIVNGADKSSQEMIYQFGIHLGLSFQLRDDFLDTFGGDSFGKKIGGDILADKKTFLLIRTLELADGEDLKKLLLLMGDSKINAESKISTVKGLMTQLGVDREADHLAQEHFERALAILEQLEVPEERKANLFSLAEGLLSRVM